MLKLRHTLLSNKLYFIILLIVVAISVPRLLVKENSILDTDTKELTGTITNFTFDGNCLTLDLKISRFENTKATYYFKELSELLKIKKSSKTWRQNISYRKYKKTKGKVSP